jgi:hypothetical protein
MEIERMKLIWVNEKLDPIGILYACIASSSEEQAKECHKSFLESLDTAQRESGWQVRMRTVESWDDVPANALTLG